MTEETRLKTLRLSEKLKTADKVLIGAGAGLSAAAGLSYFNEEVFKKYFPEMAALGYHCQYELVGMSDKDWSIGRKWAYWATHVNYVLNVFPPAELYSVLLKLLQGLDFFVVTSNADRQFFRSGFPMERVFEFQGSYAVLGCSKGCCGHTWDSMGPLMNAFKNIDHSRFECPPEAIPRCPYCSAPAEMCFRPENYIEGRDRYINFVNSCEDKSLCIIELGVGFNTPGVIRFPFERICYALPRSELFRVNRGYLDYKNHPGYPQVPKELGSRALSIDADADQVIRLLYKLKTE